MIFLFTYYLIDSYRVRVFFMPENPQLIVYTLEFCPNCDLLKGFLKNGRVMLSPNAICQQRNPLPSCG